MRKIDEEAIPFLKENGYGKGTNYTTDLVASLMIRFAENQALKTLDVGKELTQTIKMYKECLENFIPLDNQDEANLFLSTYGSGLAKELAKRGK